MNNPYAPPVAPAYPATNLYGAPQSTPVSELTVLRLRQTKPWVTLLSVIAFLLSGLMLLGGLAMVAVSLMKPGSRSQAVFGLIYLPLALLYVYPALKLWMYGTAIGRLVVSASPSDLEDALDQQKHFWKFAGIATLVTMVLYFLLIVALVGGAMTMFGKLL